LEVRAHPVLNYFSITPPENSGGAKKHNRKIRPSWQKLFLLNVQNESAAPGLGNGKSRQAL
jgi:hypothetical protein